MLTDSVIAKLVTAIPEEDWQQVEIIGWLYQFYISGKKDQVIGKVVKSEDIPVATQLFTPNWIVNRNFTPLYRCKKSVQGIFAERLYIFSVQQILIFQIQGIANKGL